MRACYVWMSIRYTCKPVTKHVIIKDINYYWRSASTNPLCLSNQGIGLRACLVAFVFGVSWTIAVSPLSPVPLRIPYIKNRIANNLLVLQNFTIARKVETFFSMLKALFSFDTRQRMKRRITTERWTNIFRFTFRSLSDFSYSEECRMKKLLSVYFHSFVQ